MYESQTGFRDKLLAFQIGSFAKYWKIPYIIIIMLICVAICFVLLEMTKYGRYLYAMGGNKTAAKLSGIDVKKMRFMAGMFAAFFIAVGGIVVCSRNSAAQVNGSDGYLMSSLAESHPYCPFQKT